MPHARSKFPQGSVPICRRQRSLACRLASAGKTRFGGYGGCVLPSYPSWRGGRFSSDLPPAWGFPPFAGLLRLPSVWCLPPSRDGLLRALSSDASGDAPVAPGVMPRPRLPLRVAGSGSSPGDSHRRPPSQPRLLTGGGNRRHADDRLRRRACGRWTRLLLVLRLRMPPAVRLLGENRPLGPVDGDARLRPRPCVPHVPYHGERESRRHVEGRPCGHPPRLLEHLRDVCVPEVLRQLVRVDVGEQGPVRHEHDAKEHEVEHQEGERMPCHDGEGVVADRRDGLAPAQARCEDLRDAQPEQDSEAADRVCPLPSVREVEPADRYQDVLRPGPHACELCREEYGNRHPVGNPFEPLLEVRLVCVAYRHEPEEDRCLRPYPVAVEVEHLPVRGRHRIPPDSDPRRVAYEVKRDANFSLAVDDQRMRRHVRAVGKEHRRDEPHRTVQGEHMAVRVVPWREEHVLPAQGKPASVPPALQPRRNHADGGMYRVHRDQQARHLPEHEPHGVPVMTLAVEVACGEQEHREMHRIGREEVVEQVRAGGVVADAVACHDHDDRDCVEDAHRLVRLAAPGSHACPSPPCLVPKRCSNNRLTAAHGVESKPGRRGPVDRGRMGSLKELQPMRNSVVLVLSWGKEHPRTDIPHVAGSAGTREENTCLNPRNSITTT